MDTSKKDTNLELFFPYYVNQGRLLDIYAILNGGYSEYAEITTTISDEKTRSGKAEINGNGGFKLFNFGTSVGGAIDNSNAQSTENKEKRVHTVTSILSIVINSLYSHGYLHNILDSKPGDFVRIPVVLSINSIKALMSELTEVLAIADIAPQKNKANASGGKKDLNNIIKSIRVFFNGEEIVYDAGEYAVVGSITDNNLYQSTRDDLIGTELTCLAQVKRVFPEGTELMKNTVFSKMKDEALKQEVIKQMAELSNSGSYEFGAVAIPCIKGKPVYQLEIVALYQS